ncbi:MAG: putative metalloprotease with PDZ domain [Candidatus Pelagisphaera sp.]|jgi:predicted metalloprotease with PDZ domain
MLQYPRLILVLLVSTLASQTGFARDPIAYTLRFPDASAHYMDVEMVIPTERAKELNLFLPTWTPGSYLVREYSRNIISLEATASGSSLEVTKTSKNRWTVKSKGTASVTINYRLFCREINVRNNWVETDFAVVNGAPTFITIVDDYKRPYLVTVELPAGWETTASPLPSAGSANSYSAPDFDTLVDSPLIAGSPQVDTFEVDGVAHSLVTIGGGGIWDNTRAARNVQHLVEAQRTFWGGLPYDEPYVFFNLLTGSRGGLEHKQSMLMTGDRWYTKNRGGIRSWLSLVSHEFFHAWNGKRLRPVELGPFEYEHENYSPSLWIVEGLTSYYQHILLARAGYHTHEKYLSALSGSIAGTEKTPGRFIQSLSESSFDAWIKAYRKDENSINALFSYYGGGAVAGFLMDAKIQQSTDGNRSLDDVLRAAFERYSGKSGYTETEFIALASEIAGKDLTDWFDSLVRQPNQFDYQPALDWFGLEFEKPKPPESNPLPVADDPEDLAKGWLGAVTSSSGGNLRVTSIPSDTPAATAGLSVDDEIIAIDQHRVDASGLKRLAGLMGAGTKVDLLVSRQGLLATLQVTLGEEPTETWKLKIKKDSTEEQKARVDKWLGFEPEEEED